MRLHTCAQVAPQLLLQECYGAVVGEGTVCAEEDLASPGDCDLIIGSLLLESTSFSCSSPENESAVWQGMGATLPCTAFPPAHLLRPGVAQPLVFCFLFHPLFHITLFFPLFPFSPHLSWGHSVHRWEVLDLLSPPAQTPNYLAFLWDCK